MYRVLLERGAEKENLARLSSAIHHRVIYEIADEIRVVRVNRARHRREAYR